MLMVQVRLRWDSLVLEEVAVKKLVGTLDETNRFTHCLVDLIST